SALFNFRSLLLVLLLIICTSSYAHSIMPGIMDRNQNGYGSTIGIRNRIYEQKMLMTLQCRIFGIFWKCARIGERLSPYVSICCVVMAVSYLPHESLSSSVAKLLHLSNLIATISSALGTP
ncbi:uncharacterized protein N7529_004626, partial [Penicillium soppii]|uniref:uncharacterized protein n=1 Tax=Penicillium soppii TaxID=69789 RepID=UPI002547DC75